MDTTIPIMVTLKRLIFLALCIMLGRAVCAQGGPYIGSDDAVSLAEHFVNETDIIYERILRNKPYDPSLFAWGMHYLARACLAMYNVTGDGYWFNRTIGITEYFAEYSDVNGDGEPSWGSYNETWGVPKWEFKEYTVWDGVISLPMIEVAKLIKRDPILSGDGDLLTRADSYVQLVRRVVERHYPFWTQVAHDQGYYWDDPTEDVGPYVNGFAALGHVELALYEITGNQTYLERPRQMANFMMANMRHDKIDDLYTWDYCIGSPPAEDISHGAIDLEFLLMANRVGLVSDQDIMRICNTYQKRIWNVPNLLRGGFPLAMRVDGSGDQDYTALSRGWILLSQFVPAIYDQQRIALGIARERDGLYPAGFVVLAVAQVPLLEGMLKSRGIDVDALETISLHQLSSMLQTAHLRLNETRDLGANITAPRKMLDEAANYANQEQLINASVPIALIWEAWKIMDRLLETGEALGDLESAIAEAEEMGAEVSELKSELSQLKLDFSRSESDSSLESIDSRVVELQRNLSRAMAEALIRMADEVVKRAKEMGIDTSRHEIFLMRAHEEFEKGNYGPAARFTEYPLRLREQVPDPVLLSGILLVLIALMLRR